MHGGLITHHGMLTPCHRYTRCRARSPKLRRCSCISMDGSRIYHRKPTVFVVMGVSGCGKSTVGALLAQRLGVPYYEGDAYHPQANIDKMKGGQPLTDEDRLPWLQQLAGIIQQHLDRQEGAVMACSALKHSYRQLLSPQQPDPRVAFVLLDPDAAVLQARLQQRAASGSHFMPPALLASQLATLEYTEDELLLHVTSDGLMPGRDEQLGGDGNGQGCRDAEQEHQDTAAGASSASVITGARTAQNASCGAVLQGLAVRCDSRRAGAAGVQDEARDAPVEALSCDGEGMPSAGFPTAVDIVARVLSKLAGS